jgi:threonylcarbamoyladenosine tRNA methylthiotransferase MtaB
MMKNFKLATLGCRTNQYETAAFKKQLETLGLSLEEGDEKADICVVNTCTVTENAHKESRNMVKKLSMANPHAKILVTGCAAEKNPESFKDIPGVAFVVGNSDKENLLAKVFPKEALPEFSINHFEAHTRAFVKVQDGCNSFCTYCIIPYVRGRSKSRPISDIIKEVESLIENGYKEVVLTGINIGDFDGGNGKDRLSDLVRAVDNVKGLKRLRISSIDPDEVDDDLLEAVINGKRTCKSMHIVLQSGSNVILKKMNRKYTRQLFLDSVFRLKEKCPTFTFTTDIIVGFPQETHRDFEDTLEVVKEVRFAKVHMFPYSPRERTKAFSYLGRIPQEVIKERKNRLLRLSEEVAFSLRNDFLGQKMSVLLEAKEGSKIHGHTDNFLQVTLDDPSITSNTIVDVLLTHNEPDGFIGKLL